MFAEDNYYLRGFTFINSLCFALSSLPSSSASASPSSRLRLPRRSPSSFSACSDNLKKRINLSEFSNWKCTQSGLAYTLPV